MVKVEITVDDGQLDLSMSELEEVPLKEIVAVKRKVKKLDLSNNQISTLQPTFASQLTNLVELDLSKNQLSEVPDNFGLLVSLVHLDLYSNKIERLPLSFKELTKLRWLDLKDNPLTPQLAKIAGPCVDQADCQKCARDVVLVMQEISRSIEQEKQRKQDERQQGAPKEKKKKRKSKSGAGNAESARVEVNTDSKPGEQVVAQHTSSKLVNTGNGSLATQQCSPCTALPLRICNMLLRAIFWSILLAIMLVGSLYLLNLPQSKPYFDKATTHLAILQDKASLHLATLQDKLVQLDIASRSNLIVAWIQSTVGHVTAHFQDFVINQAPAYLEKCKVIVMNCVDIVSAKISQLTTSN